MLKLIMHFILLGDHPDCIVQSFLALQWEKLSEASKKSMKTKKFTFELPAIWDEGDSTGFAVISLVPGLSLELLASRPNDSACIEWEKDSPIAFDSEASHIWLTALPFASCGGLIVQSAAMVIIPQEGLCGLERESLLNDHLLPIQARLHESHLQYKPKHSNYCWALQFQMCDRLEWLRGAWGCPKKGHVYSKLYCTWSCWKSIISEALLAYGLQHHLDSNKTAYKV